MSVEPSSPGVSQLMGEIRERVRRKTRLPEFYPAADSRDAHPAPEFSLDRVTRAALELREAIARFGEMSARPATFRARLGAVAVRVVRRALFFHVAQARELELVSLRAIEEQALALEALAAGFQQLWNLESDRAARFSASLDEVNARLSEIEMSIQELKSRAWHAAAP